jgi:hypothetical protein
VSRCCRASAITVIAPSGLVIKALFRRHHRLHVAAVIYMAGVCLSSATLSSAALLSATMN